MGRSLTFFRQCSRCSVVEDTFAVKHSQYFVVVAAGEWSRREGGSAWTAATSRALQDWSEQAYGTRRQACKWDAMVSIQGTNV